MDSAKSTDTSEFVALEEACETQSQSRARHCDDQHIDRLLSQIAQLQTASWSTTALTNNNHRGASSPHNTQNRKTQNIIEQLKETQERLRCIQIHNQQLSHNIQKINTQNDHLLKENQKNALVLLENENTLSKLIKELEILKSEKYQIENENEDLREQLVILKEDKKNLKTQSKKDHLTIQDYQRQCKEMQNIFVRRHPDSVSALIVTSKHPPIESDVKSLLENRISTLEDDLKVQDDNYNKQLILIQQKVNEMKDNYESHITDLEKQIELLQLLNGEIKKCKVSKADANIQTERTTFSVSTQTFHPKPVITKTTKSQDREDAHLVATVRGLNMQLAQKEKNIANILKELQLAKKTVAKLKLDSSKIIHYEKPPLRKTLRQTAPSKLLKGNSDIANDKENIKLKNDLADLQKDFERLKKKRMEDLQTLQATHEKELMNLNVKVFPLQDNVDVLNITVEMLRNQIKLMDEQLSLIMMERDNFKHKAEILSFKLNKYLEADQGSESKHQYQPEDNYNLLKLKVAELEKRQEGREVRLKNLLESVSTLKAPSPLHLT